MPLLLLLLAVATYAQPQPPLLDERDGKTYKTVKIGTHIWMAENLNYEAEGSKCYENKPENCEKFGRLYNWQTAMKSCPNGWRVPSRVEWENLVIFVGGDSIAGKKLKAKNWGWASSLYDYFILTDNFGFSALPATYRSDIKKYGRWWSATIKAKENCPYNYYLSHCCDYMGEGCSAGDFSVRCVNGSEEEAIAIQKARQDSIDVENTKRYHLFFGD